MMCGSVNALWFSLLIFWYVCRPYELLALEYNGHLRSYFISPTEGFKPYHTFVFCDTILSSAVYVPLFNILVIAFPVSSLNEKVCNSQYWNTHACNWTCMIICYIFQQSNEDTLGLSTWRLLNDHPYYRLVKPNIENLQISNTGRSWISLPSPKKKRVTISLNIMPMGESYVLIFSLGSVTDCSS